MEKHALKALERQQQVFCSPEKLKHIDSKYNTFYMNKIEHS